MRNFANVLTVTLFAVLAAGIAVAGTIHPLEKVEPVKGGDPSGDSTLGFLDCSGAIVVDISSGFWTDTSTNVGAPNNVNYYSCSGWNESGGEVVYVVTFPDDVVWEVGLSGMACDLDLAVLDMCDEDLGCLIVANVGVYVSEPFPGQFYFVVDGYNGAACDYTITFTTTPYEAPEPVDFCSLVEEVEGTGIFTGDTCGGQNLIATLPCLSWTENGLEAYYEVFMPAGSMFTVDLTHSVDAAIWVLGACVEPFDCLVAVDDIYPGTTETISYTNAGGDTIVYLVIDSYGTNSCGPYSFNFVSTGGAIATEVKSLDAVKTIFR